MAKPLPPSNLSSLVETVIWPERQVIHRIHPERFGSTQFNPTGAGNARFSPIQRTDASIIPTIYGGSDFDCAAMETVFHDLPHGPGLKTVKKANVAFLGYSQIACSDRLRLISLKNIPLRALGLKRTDIIDTEVTEYPFTRTWAEAFHAQCPDHQGLLWQSKQADHAEAIVLFGDRLDVSKLSVVSGSHNVATTPVYTNLIQLALRIKVDIV